jgi:hypothetical protein
VSEKLTDQARDAGVVSLGVTSCAFNHTCIDRDVETFLGHKSSNAHYYCHMIRIIEVLGKTGSDPSVPVSAAARETLRSGSLPRLTSGLPHAHFVRGPSPGAVVVGIH